MDQISKKRHPADTREPSAAARGLPAARVGFSLGGQRNSPPNGDQEGNWTLSRKSGG